MNQTNTSTVKPCYIATIGKREFWRYNESGDISRSGFLPVTCRHSKMRMDIGKKKNDIYIILTGNNIDVSGYCYKAFKQALLFLFFLLFPTFFLSVPTFPYFFIKMPYYPYFSL